MKTIGFRGTLFSDTPISWGWKQNRNFGPPIGGFVSGKPPDGFWMKKRELMRTARPRGGVDTGPQIFSAEYEKWKIGKGHPAKKEKASCCLVRDMETSQVYQKKVHELECVGRERLMFWKQKIVRGHLADKEACIYCTLFDLVHMFSWLFLK